MSEAMEMVRAFHDAMGYPNGDPDRPALPPEHRRKARMRKLSEEHAEVCRAEGTDDLVEIAHELADLIFVAYGHAIEYGIDLDAVLREVWVSNMTKDPPEGGQGRAVKGDRFVEADVESVLGLNLVEIRDFGEPEPQFVRGEPKGARAAARWRAAEEPDDV